VISPPYCAQAHAAIQPTQTLQVQQMIQMIQMIQITLVIYKQGDILDARSNARIQATITNGF
jgi:hypothetical protein